MKTLFTFCILGFVSIDVFSNENLAIWPIQNSDPGKGIIYQPGDYIGEKYNYGNLIIAAPQNSSIISPESGTIITKSYGYLFSLSFSSTFTTNYSDSEDDKEFRIKLAEKHNEQNKEFVDFQFINYRLGIKTDNGDVIYIRGIINPEKYITGQRIEKGDLIGKIGYSYYKIPQPSIIISRSIDSKAADPMGMFGLQTTFVKYKSEQIHSDDKLSPDKLTADFSIFKESLEEGHPGLYDYISKDSLDFIFTYTQKILSETKTVGEFYDLLSRIVLSIHDCHTNISNPFDGKQCKLTSHPPVLLGVQSNDLLVIRAMPEYLSLVGKRVRNVDNVPAKNIIPKIRKTINSRTDGFIQSEIDLVMFNFFWIYYDSYVHKNFGDTLKIDFYDGRSQDFIYSYNSLRDYVPKYRRNTSPGKGSVEMRFINDTLPLIDINSFHLTETDMLNIVTFIKKISDNNYNNLIIDLRNNGGGNSNNLFSYLATKPYQINSTSKVNKTDTYDFFKYTDNYFGVSGLFIDYTEKKDDGYYSPVSESKYIIPNDSVNYNGNLYVLVNSFSKSASANFAGLVKKNNRGLIIGRETGGAYYQLNAVKFANLILPNSKIKVRIPLVKVINDLDKVPGIPWGRGVIPDIKISLTIDEFTKEEDVFLEAAIKKIHDYSKTKSNDIGNKSKISEKLIFIIPAIIILIVILWIIKKYATQHSSKGKASF